MIGRKRKDSGISRSVARLNARLDNSLSAYATAAGAAGVSLLVFAIPAEAKIVYTPASINIPANGSWIPIDLNHDGTADFSFSRDFFPFTDGSVSYMDARAGGRGNAIWGRGYSGRSQARKFAPPKGGSIGGFAAALHAGFKVRPNKSYFQEGTNQWLMARRAASHRSVDTTNTAGQWNYTQHRYLGLKFMIDGKIHYGWARVNWETSKVTGYAYETIPNKPIIAGKTKGPDVIKWEPATLGRLAQGASGISAWREKK
jgi:hypothetical protein